MVPCAETFKQTLGGSMDSQKYLVINNVFDRHRRQYSSVYVVYRLTYLTIIVCVLLHSKFTVIFY